MHQITAIYLFVFLSVFLLENVSSMDLETFDFPDSIKGNLIILSNKCVEETGVQRKVLRSCAETKQIPDDKAAKCYLKCLHDNFGVDLEKQVADITHHEAQTHGINEHVHEMVSHIQSKCDSIHADDPCEEAWLKTNCQLKMYEGNIEFCHAMPFFGH